MVRTTIIAAMLVAGPGSVGAQGFGDQEALVLEGLGLYSNLVGHLDACGRGPGYEAVDDVLDEVAAWRHSGFLAGLTGARDDYRAEIEVAARVEFSDGRDGCAFGPGPRETMLSELEVSLHQLLETSFE